MTVDRVPAGVELAIGEPFIERRVVVEERLRRRSSQSMPLAASIQKASGSALAAA
jgi:hypothetical protein